MDIVKKLNVNLGAKETKHIKESLLTEKENEVSIERNLHPTSDAVIIKNKYSDVRMVQQKEEQEIETTIESSTATGINAITATEPLHKININSKFATSMRTTISTDGMQKRRKYSLQRKIKW